jgi:TetR/AcrR family transcriptional repressor of nem operon
MARTKTFDEVEILDRAIALFGEHGYNGISMQELVDGLGINRSSLYDTFGDKEALYVATLKHYRSERTRKMVDLIQQSDDVRATLKNILDFVISDSLDPKSKTGCMMVNTAVELAPHQKKLATLVSENMTAIEEALTQALKRAQADRQISKRHNATALAHVIANAINGFRVAAKYGADRKLYDNVVHVLMSLLD